MQYQVITAPTAQPVTLAEAKDHLRIDHTIEDALIEGLIAAAVGVVENYTNRKILTTEVMQFYPAFHYNLILNFGYVSDLVSVKYLDIEEAEQTAVDLYSLLGTFSPPQLVQKLNACFPATAGRNDAVRVIYKVGWTTADQVPAPIKSAILLIITELYENRENINYVSRTSQLRIRTSAHMILDPFRIWTF